MREFQIFSDSACDVPEQLLTSHNIKLIPFYVSFDQDIYYKENIEITNEDFYERLSKDKAATTSLPTVQDYMNEFRAVLKNGKDILCLCLTQKFSGSYQSAVNAKTILEEQYPESNIRIIDSIQATGGQGLLLLQIAYLKAQGLSLEEVVQKAALLKSTARIMFTVDSLEYLRKGRRIGKAISLMGDKLDLKPLIQLRDGELLPYSKVRGRKNSLEKLIVMTCEYFKEAGEAPENYDFCIADAATIEDARYLKDLLEKFLKQPLKYPVFQIGVTIGTNTGPGGIGICFIKKYNQV